MQELMERVCGVATAMISFLKLCLMPNATCKCMKYTGITDTRKVIQLIFLIPTIVVALR